MPAQKAEFRIPAVTLLAAASCLLVGERSRLFLQTLTATLESNVIYHLTGYAGHPVGFGSTPPATGYYAELWAGGTLLATTGISTGPESWLEGFVLTYDTSSSPNGIGQAIEIRLGSTQAQTAFDDIELTIAPEPASLAVWSLLALSISGYVWRQRRS